MARPAAWRRSLAAYPRSEAIQTRFQDMDVLGHLNNVAYAALFETARARFNQAAGLFHTNTRRSLVARVDIEYLSEGHYPDDVIVGTGIGEIGNRSWQILAAMFQHDRCIATCDTTLVMERAEDGGGLPDDFRTGLEELRVKGPAT